MNIGKGILILLEIVLLAAFVNAFFLNVSNIGNITGTVAALVLLGITIFWKQFSSFIGSLWQHTSGKISLCIISLLLAAGICLAGFLTIRMAAHINNPPETPCTAVVLGCKVKGTEPSLMLKRRLEAAQSYLEANPETMCIVSGGQGAGEDITEAEAMKRYLTGSGIDSSRIILEDSSVNTRENIEFSKAVLEENGLGEDIVIITDGFHQYRASLIAEKIGLEAYSVSCYTRPELVPAYWVREWFALVKEIFLA